MKRLIAAFTMAAAMSAGAASLTETYDAEAARTTALVDAGKMTETQQAQALAQLARDLFPRDGRFLELRDFKVGLAQRFDRGEISREQYDAIWTARRDAYQSDRAAAQAQSTAPAGQPNVAGALALGVAADSFNRARGASTTCRSTAVGTAVYTSCQ